MRLTFIELTGFQSFVETSRLELDDVNLAAVVGENRSGKSTLILDAVMYALYGESRASMSRCVSRSAKSATVTLGFTVGASRYEVTRSRMKRGGNTLTLVQCTDTGTIDLSSKNPTDTTKTITDLIGMSYATANLTWVMSDTSPSLTRMRPAERRAHLASAFGLDAYRESYRRANTALNESKNRLVTLDATLGALDDADGANQGVDVEQARRARDEAVSALETVDANAAAMNTLREFDASRNAANALYESKRTTLDAALDAARHAELAARHAVEEAHRAGAREGVLDSELSDAEAELVRAEQVVQAQRSRLDELNAQVTTITTMRSQRSENIESLRKGLSSTAGECYTCHQSLSSDDAQVLIRAKIEANDADAVKLSSLNTERADVTKRLNEGSTDVHATNARVAALRAERTSVNAISEQLAARMQAHHDAQAAFDEASRARRELVAPTYDESERARLVAACGDAADVAAFSSRRAELVAARDAAISALTLAEHAAAQRTERETQRKATLREREQAERDVMIYTTLRDAYHDSGIPTMILTDAINDVNEAVNEMMALTGDDGLNVMISTTHAARDEVSVLVINDGETTEYETLSGSERFRVDLALRLAVMKVVAAHAGSSMVETIIIDEGWGALDETHRIHVQQMLAELSSTFDIYTVSHIDSVKAAFPVTIEVSKNSRGSHARVVVL